MTPSLTMKQNILDVKQGYICHQVNCMGVMGSGLAHQIAERYPRVYGSYRGYLEYYGQDECFGTSQVVQVADNLSVVNLFGQYRYGRNDRHTDYNALRLALNHFSFNQTMRRLCKKKVHAGNIYFPKFMGCGLGGGDWCVVQGIIGSQIQQPIFCEL